MVHKVYSAATKYEVRWDLQQALAAKFTGESTGGRILKIG